MRVEPLGIERQLVAALARDDRAGAAASVRARQCLAQTRDLHLQRLGGAGRRALPPELVDQPVCCERLVGVEQQQRQQRPLPAPPKRDRCGPRRGPRAGRGCGSPCGHCFHRVVERLPVRRMIVSDVAPPHKESVMSQAISTQHPAVVLRSRYQQLRALLAVAMIAVVGLTAAVVILAIQNDGNTIVRVQPVRRTRRARARSFPDGRPEESAVAATLGPQQTCPAPMRAVSRRQSGPASSGRQLPRAPTRAPSPARFRAASRSSFPVRKGPRVRAFSPWSYTVRTLLARWTRTRLEVVCGPAAALDEKQQSLSAYSRRPAASRACLSPGIRAPARSSRHEFG